MKKRASKKDIFFIALLFVIAVLLFVFTTGLTKKNGRKVIVTVDGETYGEYDLYVDDTVEIKKNDVTTNVLEIKAGRAHMIEADCPDGLCMHQGYIFRDGQMIVCLPNSVVVTVESDIYSDVDSISK